METANRKRSRVDIYSTSTRCSCQCHSHNTAKWQFLAFGFGLRFSVHVPQVFFRTWVKKLTMVAAKTNSTTLNTNKGVSILHQTYNNGFTVTSDSFRILVNFLHTWTYLLYEIVVRFPIPCWRWWFCATKKTRSRIAWCRSPNNSCNFVFVIFTGIDLKSMNTPEYTVRCARFAVR